MFGAMPVIVTALTAGVTTLPVTTTLGAEPISSDSPVGVIILPLTISGISPTKVKTPLVGVTLLLT